MSHIEEVQYDAIGHILEVTAKKRDADGTLSVRDISGQTALAIYGEPPSGTVKTFTGSLTTDGTDGKFQYATVSGDLDESGIWKFQGKVTEGSSPIQSSGIGKLLVKDNLV